MKMTHLHKVKLLTATLLFITVTVFAQEVKQTPLRMDDVEQREVFERIDSTKIERPRVIPNLKNLDLQKIGIDFIQAGEGSEGMLLSSPISGGGDGYLPDFSHSVPSPNASALMRAVNNPVNLATGTTSIEAPLYTLMSGSIQIPISLTYQATGIEVGQKASNVGLGWRFSGGGQVTRVVKGFPDEQAGVSSHKSQGWCNGWPFTNEVSVYEWFAYDFWSTSSYYAGNGQLDNEPDLFYFEIPGKSGMFVFDHSGNAHTIPYQNISISWISRSYFQIIDEDGSIYTFGSTSSSREVTQMDFPNENIRNDEREIIECTTTWFLDTVESMKGDKVTFTYISGPSIKYTNYSRNYELKDITSNTSFTETVKSNDGTVTIASPKYLSKITAATTEIAFGISTRSTLPAYMGFSNQYTFLEIRSINVPTSAVYTKRIALNYSTFRNGEPKLTRINELVNGVEQNLFSFTYYDENANYPNPHDFTTYIDFWGYWTSTASSSTLRPAINFFRTYFGKYTNFTYLPLAGNMDGFIPSSYKSSNSTLPLPHFSTTGYASQTSDYTINSWRMPLGPYYLDDYDYDTFWMDTSTNQDGNPFVISGSNRNANLNGTKAYVLQMITFPTGGYLEYTYEQNEITHKGNTPRGPDNTYKVGGLRIKTIKQNDGKTTSTTTYNYSQGVPIRDVRDEYFYTVTSQSTDSNPKWTINASSNAVLSPTDLGGSHVIYPTVEVVNPDGSKSIHEFSTPATSVYLFDDRPMYAIVQDRYKVAKNAPAKNVEKSENKNFARVKGWVAGFGYQYQKLNSRHYMRGLPISETVKDPSGNTVNRTEYTYLVGKPKGTVLAYKPSRIYRCPALFVFQYVSQPVLPKKITVTAQKYNPDTAMEYTYTTTDYRPKEVTKTINGGGTTISGNANVVMTQRIKYSNEYSTSTATYEGEAGGIKSLQERKAVVPIEVITIRNDSVVSAEINSYKSLARTGYARTAVPYAKYAIATDVGIPVNSISNSTIYTSDTRLVKHARYEEVSRIDKYDNKANPVYTTSPFSNDKVYVYGYNGMLPIAEVEIPRDAPSTPYTFHSETLPIGTFDASMPEWIVPYLIIPNGSQVVIRLNFTNVQTLNMNVGYIDIYRGEIVIIENVVRSGGVTEVIVPFISPPTEDMLFLYFENTCTKTNPLYGMSCDMTVLWSRESGDNLTGTYVFHTSFEGNGEGTALAKAKTGVQAKSGTYTINFSDFTPGDYLLTYWKSMDNGISWEKITENLMITSGMTSKVIGGSFYIDEVRLIPRGALIKTYTYRPDAGKTSETDHNGNTRYWEYDNWGHLVRILDSDRRVLETYEYNIKN